MDGKIFDVLVARSFGDASRRRLLRGGLGALTVAGLGLAGLSTIEDTQAAKRGRRGRRGKRGKRGPVGPSGSDGADGQTVTCASGQTICGPGCCSSSYPVCCDYPPSAIGVSCNEASNTCCGTGFSNKRNGGACPTGVDCCHATSDCALGSECESGCCAVQCSVLGESCSTKFDCCTHEYGVEGALCQANTCVSCSGDQETCSGDTDCCGASATYGCYSGICKSCSGAQETCSGDTECCGASATFGCTGGICGYRAG